MGGAVKKITNKAANVYKYANPISYVGMRAGQSLAQGQNPFKNIVNDYTHGYENSPAPSSPDNSFSISPEEIKADRDAINALGDSQYNATLGAIDQNSEAQKTFAADTFKQMLPQIAEDYNAGHLLNSTGYQQEAARQAYQLASQVAADRAQQRFGALQGLQGFQNSALERGLGLQDFIRQSNVAKAIGAQAAPQSPSGKGGALQGAGAGAIAAAPLFAAHPLLGAGVLGLSTLAGANSGRRSK